MLVVNHKNCLVLYYSAVIFLFILVIDKTHCYPHFTGFPHVHSANEAPKTQNSPFPQQAQERIGAQSSAVASSGFWPDANSHWADVPVFNQDWHKWEPKQVSAAIPPQPQKRENPKVPQSSIYPKKASYHQQPEAPKPQFSPLPPFSGFSSGVAKPESNHIPYSSGVSKANSVSGASDPIGFTGFGSSTPFNFQPNENFKGGQSFVSDINNFNSYADQFELPNEEEDVEEEQEVGRQTPSFELPSSIPQGPPPSFGNDAKAYSTFTFKQSPFPKQKFDYRVQEKVNPYQYQEKKSEAYELEPNNEDMSSYASYPAPKDEGFTSSLSESFPSKVDFGKYKESHDDVEEDEEDHPRYSRAYGKRQYFQNDEQESVNSGFVPPKPSFAGNEKFSRFNSEKNGFASPPESLTTYSKPDFSYETTVNHLPTSKDGKRSESFASFTSAGSGDNYDDKKIAGFSDFAAPESEDADEYYKDVKRYEPEPQRYSEPERYTEEEAVDDNESYNRYSTRQEEDDEPQKLYRYRPERFNRPEEQEQEEEQQEYERPNRYSEDEERHQPYRRYELPKYAEEKPDDEEEREEQRPLYYEENPHERRYYAEQEETDDRKEEEEVEKPELYRQNSYRHRYNEDDVDEEERQDGGNGGHRMRYKPAEVDDEEESRHSEAATYHPRPYRFEKEQYDEYEKPRIRSGGFKYEGDDDGDNTYSYEKDYESNERYDKQDQGDSKKSHEENYHRPISDSYDYQTGSSKNGGPFHREFGTSYGVVEAYNGEYSSDGPPDEAKHNFEQHSGDKFSRTRDKEEAEFEEQMARITGDDDQGRNEEYEWEPHRPEGTESVPLVEYDPYASEGKDFSKDEEYKKFMEMEMDDKEFEFMKEPMSKDKKKMEEFLNTYDTRRKPKETKWQSSNLGESDWKPIIKDNTRKY